MIELQVSHGTSTLSLTTSLEHPFSIFILQLVESLADLRFFTRKFALLVVSLRVRALTPESCCSFQLVLLVQKPSCSLHAHASVRCEGAFYSLLLLTMGPDGPDLSRFRLSGKQQNIQEDFNCSLIISSSDLRDFFTLIFNSLEEDCVL